MFYDSHSVENTKQIIKLTGESNLSRLIEKYIREVFDHREVSKPLRKKLFDYYFKNLSKALNKTYKPSLEFYDKDLIKLLTENIAEFSAFKEVSFQNSLLDIIKEKGALPTWSEFKKRALNNSKLFNSNWLKTEIQHTIASANMALKWGEFQADKDLYPNLKYVTVGDERVRDSHKKWDGYIAPVDSSVWKWLTPPTDYGCRCDLVQTDEDPSKELPEGKPDKAFQNNPYFSGKIFTESAYEQNLNKEGRNNARSNFDEFYKED